MSIEPPPWSCAAGDGVGQDEALQWVAAVSLPVDDVEHFLVQFRSLQKVNRLFPSIRIILNRNYFLDKIKFDITGYQMLISKIILKFQLCKTIV